MRKIVALFFLIASVIFAAYGADKKQIKQLKADIASAKDAIKNAVDMEKNDNNAQKKLNALEKSEQTIAKYLSQDEYRERKDLYLLLIDLVRKQYEAGNEKMYLKQKVDTAWYVRTGRRMFLTMEKFDSLDAKPNEKGVSEPSYRKKHGAFLAPYRENIKKGGIYFLKHKEWAEAWQCFDVYLESRNWKMFADQKNDSVDDRKVAYLSVVSAKEIPDLDKALKYSTEVLADTAKRENALMLLSELSLDKGDSALYVKYITEGFKQYPLSEYFFPRLIDYHTERGDYVRSEKYVDEALKKDSLNGLFLLAKHTVLMSMEKYDDALRYASLLQQRNDTLPKLNYNIGYIYNVKAQQTLKKTGVPYRHRMKEAQKYYRLLLPYMEKYREEKPEDRQRWYPILYDAYLNLNKGKEFNALEGK